ncbi:RNA-dependent DNA polymerase, partial [Vibrio parahaemolyticus]
MKKSKLKIKTNGKEYSLKDSPFYNIKTKKRLSILIGCTLSELKAFSKDQGNYHEFLEKSTGGKSRKIQQP